MVAPLDWGLGHATRSIPVIDMLLQKGCEVWIATAGAQEKLLKEAFPKCKFLHLQGYGVYYGRYGVLVNLLRQVPGIRQHIKREHAWLQQTINTHGFNGVISDNRYGLYSSYVPTVLITHQLALQIPMWCSFATPFVQKALYKYINSFDECWVPDLPEENSSLAGRMSHPSKLPKSKVYYIGWLSRFNNLTADAAFIKRNQTIMISLSGPEPQRTLLESKILQQIAQVDKPIVLVRGLPGITQNLPESKNMKVFNHLATSEMANLMQTCRLLICRSGYSTLMDAFTLNTPLACVPTPGQTEQEYLADKLAKAGRAAQQHQSNFNLKALIDAGLQMANSYSNVNISNTYLLENHLDKWLAKLKD